MQYRGYYTDGFTAQRHDVIVQPGRAALHLHREMGGALDEWPYGGLYLSEPVHGQGPARLRHRGRGEAMLTVTDTRLLDRIAELGGPRLRGGFWSRPTLYVGLSAVVLLAVVVGAAYLLAPRLLAPLARLVPADWEVALGEQVVDSMAHGNPPCSGPAGVAALHRLSERLTQAMGPALGPEGKLPYPIQVQVIPSGTINAFAAPGGRIVLLRGLIDFAQSPDEVAGVLAHEMAHVAHRHPMQGLIRVAGTTLVLQALLGDRSSVESAAGRFAQWMVLTSYTREDELSADRSAVKLLNAADIEGRGLASFLARVESRRAEKGNALPSMLSTHPVFQDRISLVQSTAKGHGTALTPRQWKALQTVCEG